MTYFAASYCATNGTFPRSVNFRWASANSQMLNACVHRGVLPFFLLHLLHLFPHLYRCGRVDGESSPMTCSLIGWRTMITSYTVTAHPCLPLGRASRASSGYTQRPATSGPIFSVSLKKKKKKRTGNRYPPFICKIRYLVEEIMSKRKRNHSECSCWASRNECCLLLVPWHK